MGAPDETAPVGTRHRHGVIALTADHKKVAVVAPAGNGGPQFPSAPLPREALADRLQDQLETALEIGEKQLGLDLAEYLCSQPVIHALGPEPKASTKFFLAFNVPEQALSSSDEGQAAWEELQPLLEDAAGQQVAGNQLVAVLRQLQGMLKRRYEMVMPADDGYQEIAELLGWHEAAGESAGHGIKRWTGIAPKEFLEEHCRKHKLPAPCFNVFEHDRTAQRTHFCATCLLSHLGLQITPDAVYPSPLDALENAAMLAILYLQGALAPDCALVHFAAAGEMAQVPHAFLTEQEVRQNVRQQQAQEQRRLEERKRGQQGGGPLAPAFGGALGPAGGDRPSKRPRQDRPPATVAQALGAIPRDRHPLMVIKEVCDKCRFAPPFYEELSMADGRTVVAITLPQAGVTRTLGPPHADRKQAKTLAAQASSSSGSSGSAAPACSLPFQGRP
ncbi:hypothetical protein ABPG77_001207 [Micractinium sp. CCAP 211/92]